MNVLDFQACKARNEKIVMLTCYDYTSACIVQDSDVDVILVGDSAAMVMHGYGTTIPADIEMMCRHIETVLPAVQGTNLSWGICHFCHSGSRARITCARLPVS
jgi:3-methyl-2-oxobutanoate hydroxymethyltransferase